VPKDVSQSKMEWWYPSTIEEFDLPGYRPEVALDEAAVARAVELISQSQRPVLYVGGGTLKSKASPELLAFAERTNMPVVTTLMARGAFPDSHDLHLGMPGMHGMYSAVTAIQKCDLLISLGARFDDRVTGKISTICRQRQSHSRRHRPGRIQQSSPGRRLDPEQRRGRTSSL
jgi:acetolactate synthase-1/2/3 large subunit